MRKPVRILSLHMAMAASYWQRGFESGAQTPAAIYDDMHAIVSGIQLYRAHSYARNLAPLKCVYKDGCVSVLCAGDAADENAPVVLLVPSLINKSDILDLHENRSLLRWLSAQGARAYLLDWGDVSGDDGAPDLDAVVADKLIGAAAFLTQHHGQKIHALGYCMGGTLSVAAAALKPDYFASLVTLAAPWDFHAGSQALLQRVKFWAPGLLSSAASHLPVDVDWLQMVFASLDPHFALKKFARFAAMDQDSEKAALFVAVEDWLNDGVALPYGVAKNVIEDWFFANAPAQQKWSIGGHAIVPQAVDIPALVVASSKDTLVEFDTAKALADALPRAVLHDPACGHIGMIAGGDAIGSIWQRIADWIYRHSMLQGEA
ncbi:MAG: alpha/beta fold hydrolase [Bdellovibrionales bacterium]